VIQGSPTGLDSDADPLTYTWRWLKNDAPIEGGNSPTIEASRFQRGDLVRAEVMAHDGESESTPVQSDPFTVDNLPPQFSSKPAPPKEGDQVFRYQAVAVDPDHDPLRYELVRAPAGMTVEPEGLVVWNLPPRDARGVDAAVTLKVSDSKGGEAVQEFSIQFGASKR
jgi:hypothetical protein